MHYNGAGVPSQAGEWGIIPNIWRWPERDCRECRVLVSHITYNIPSSVAKKSASCHHPSSLHFSQTIYSYHRNAPSLHVMLLWPFLSLIFAKSNIEYWILTLTANILTCGRLERERESEPSVLIMSVCVWLCRNHPEHPIPGLHTWSHCSGVRDAMRHMCRDIADIRIRVDMWH